MGKKIRIGIDIGSKGGLAVFEDSVLAMSCAIPKDENDKTNIADVAQILEDWWGSPKNGDTVHVVIEDLHSIYGSSAASNFTFGWNNGVIQALLTAFYLPFTKVQPKKWQKEMWEGVKLVQNPTGKDDKKGNPKYKTDTKATSLLAARRLFPNEDFLATSRSKKAHDGIVDAVLLAEYCRRHF